MDKFMQLYNNNTTQFKSGNKDYPYFFKHNNGAYIEADIGDKIANDHSKGSSYHYNIRHSFDAEILNNMFNNFIVEDIACIQGNGDTTKCPATPDEWAVKIDNDSSLPAVNSVAILISKPLEDGITPQGSTIGIPSYFQT